MTSDTKVMPTDANRASFETGVVAKNGGLVILDQPFRQEENGKTYLATALKTGGGGDMMVEGVDGGVIPYFNLSPDRYVLVYAQRVLSSAVTSDGSSYTTGATNITWYGGV